MIIGGIYRSPNNSCDNNEKLWKTITYMASLHKDNMLLMGDFNCSGIDWTNQLTVDQDTNSLNNKLIETLRDCYLKQVITENTRARGSNIPSLLDLVLCYDREQISTNIAYLGPLGKSDHCVVTLLYNITFESCSYKVKRNMYDKGDYTAINPCSAAPGCTRIAETHPFFFVVFFKMFNGKDFDMLVVIVGQYCSA